MLDRRPRRPATAGWSTRTTAPALSWRVSEAVPSRSPCCAPAPRSSPWSTPPPAPTTVPTSSPGPKADRSPATAGGDVDLRHRELAAGDVVFLNHGAWQRPVWNGRPARRPASCRCPRSPIAWRASRWGTASPRMTLRPVNALDIAAGHALLMAAGGVLVAEDGVPVTYNDLGESRPSACFGGRPAVDTLRPRAWRGSPEPRREPRVTLAWPRRPEGGCSIALPAACLGWRSAATGAGHGTGPDRGPRPRGAGGL